MQSMRDIRSRIGSVRDIRHITRAMKMVSVAKLHRAEAHAEKAKYYCRRIDEIYDFIFRKTPWLSHPLMRAAEGDRELIIGIASDKGLCGPYNSNVVKKIAEHVARKGGERVICRIVGVRGVRLCRARGINCGEEGYASAMTGSSVRAGAIVQDCIDRFMKKEITKVVVIYNVMQRAGAETVCEETLLPLAAPAEGKRPERTNYAYEPDIEFVVDALCRELVMVRFNAMMIEANRAEHRARMQAMESATNNASDLIDNLTISYNKARQSSITSEIIDIVGGAEALA